MKATDKPTDKQIEKIAKRLFNFVKKRAVKRLDPEATRVSWKTAYQSTKERWLDVAEWHLEQIAKLKK